VSSKKGRRPYSKRANVSTELVGGTTYHSQESRSSNPSINTENLAKNITVRQNQNEIILMFLQGLERVNNDQHKSTQKAVAKLQGDISKLLEIKESEKIAKREAGR